ncbi:MAG: DUF6293 family protein [Ardenticatenaceae bacterium]|nr:DUF6293 family protein [Ardenticatenaceae bacterium]
MGVYHLMGLGLSLGTVTGPLSYLGYRYQRWDKEDQAFFSRSGEVKQREAGEKVGDVQALVLFTTQEVIVGRDEVTGKILFPRPYVVNHRGRISAGEIKSKAPMKESLIPFLEKTWPEIAGGRREGTIFWCEVDRRDIQKTFNRIARVIVALSRKEQWVNLTGGNNVTNFALQLASSLSGEVARLYYVQAENEQAEKCIFYTSERGYWVDIPVMPLVLSRVNRAILHLLGDSPATLQELYSRLCYHQEYGVLILNIPSEALLENHVSPMWTQGLISGTSEKTGPYTLGPQWEIIRPYEVTLEQARQQGVTIEQLARQEPWLSEQTIPLI